VTCPSFDYDAATATAVYQRGALLRSGADEVRADEIRIEDSGHGKRRLTATGEVVSRMQPRPSSKQATLPAIVEGRAEKMVYEETLGEIVYTDDVVIQQGDIVTHSPTATLRLSEDGADVRELVVGEPVEVQQGERTAEGRIGVYTPAEQTMVLEGERVVLTDPTQQVQGRSVTFEVGGDRILIEGQEQVRTQTVIRPQGPPP
jgi:lipopolysaccharide transport protein LptA